MRILTLNAGSSSIKFALYQADAAQLSVRLHGEIERIGDAPQLQVRDAEDALVHEQRWTAADLPDAAAAERGLDQWLRAHLGGLPDAIGHRVVHGGVQYAKPVRVDAAVLADLQQFEPLAPLHQPYNLAPIRAWLARAPQIPQVACFDTAFHRGHDEIVDLYALPRELIAAGVRRYGFHGLSYEYIAAQLRMLDPQLASGRVVLAHLGNGASLCALQAGRSVDSSMGFSALEGLVMGTRPGSVDPGVLLYLMQERGMDAAAIEHLLYHDCGLKGLSGESGDVRTLLASSRPQARQALEVFAHRIAQQTAAMAASMGGIDAMVFTAGIGEHAAAVREQVVERLRLFDARLDAAANAAGAGARRIHAPDSRIALWVIPTDEERMIALHTQALLGDAKAN